MQQFYFLKKDSRIKLFLYTFLVSIFFMSPCMAEEEGTSFSLGETEHTKTGQEKVGNLSTDFAAQALLKFSDAIHQHTKQIVTYVEDLATLPETIHDSWSNAHTKTFFDHVAKNIFEICLSVLMGIIIWVLFILYQKRTSLLNHKQSEFFLLLFNIVKFSFSFGATFLLTSLIVNDQEVRYFLIRVIFGFYIYQICWESIRSLLSHQKKLKESINPSSKENLSTQTLFISAARSFRSFIRWLLGGYISNLILECLQVSPHLIMVLWAIFGVILVSLVTNIVFKVQPFVEEHLKKTISSIKQPLFAKIINYLSGKIAYFFMFILFFGYLAFVFEEDTQVFFIKLFSSILLIFLAYVLGLLWGYLYKIWTDTDSFLARISPIIALHLGGALKVLGWVIVSFIYFFTFIFITRLWGYDVIKLIDTTFNIKSLNILLDIALTITLGVILWQVLEMSFEHYLRKFSFRTKKASEKDIKKLQRLQTLLPILENGIRWILFILFFLVILSQIGIDITPLLTGLGLFGLAFSFGAQSFVKDLITGFNVLMDGSINVGDYVIVNKNKGSVENLTLRNLEVRDIETGALHVIPFSEVSTISNFSRDFNYCSFEISFENSADLNQVTQLISSVVEDMKNDPSLKSLILDHPAVWGVKKMTGLDVSLEGRFKIAPMSELYVRPEFYKRLRAAYIAHGIRLASPAQLIYMETSVEDKPSSPLPK